MKKTALLFPGQGSQYVGMGKALCEKYPIAKQVFEEANDTLGFDIKSLCFEGSMEELTKTENTQPAILTTSVASFKAYMQEIGAEPAYLAGHSLGEISALACTGGIKFADALRIVRQRGKFMQVAVPLGIGAMAAVSGIGRDTIEQECKNYYVGDQVVVVSNYNSPDQIVISGNKAAVDAVSEKLKAAGARVTPLKVSAPFHSPLMQQAADMLRVELSNYTYSPLKWPVISNVTALPYESHETIIETLSTQIVQAVRWQPSMEYLQNKGVEIAVEMAPQTVLRNLMKKNASAVIAFAFDKEDDVQALKKAVSNSSETAVSTVGNNITVVTRCLAIAVCTKNTNWDNDAYQKGVIEPYRKIQDMQNNLEKEGKEPSTEQMYEALKMLESVFKTKQTPVEEQIERFNQIFDETCTRHLLNDFKMPVI